MRELGTEDVFSLFEDDLSTVCEFRSDIDRFERRLFRERLRAFLKASYDSTVLAVLFDR
jgi:hypothetical protein